MNDFQLGLKLQVSGAEVAQTALGNVTKQLGEQLTGIKEFTTKLGEGNQSVRGYIESAKEMIEQNPIQETLGKLSGLAQAMGLEKVSGGIEATAGSLKSWTGEITDFLGKTEKASDLIKEVLEGDVSEAIDTVAQNIEKLSSTEGIAKALGLESVLTSAQQTKESVDGMIGKFQEFGNGANSAGEIVKRVLLTDTQGAIDTVRTSLGAMGNFSDLATRMGLHGVASEIDGLQKSVGEWTGKIEDFNKRSTDTAAQLNTAFGSTLPPGVSKAAGAIMELTGTKDKLMPMLEGIQTNFQTLTGKSFPDAFKGMQDLSKEFGNGGISAKNLGDVLKSSGGAARLMAGGFGIVGAAIAGWQIGKAIGDMDLFGIKINDVAQYSISKAMQGFEKFKRWLRITSEEEYKRNSKAWGDAAEQATMNKPAPKSPETAAPGAVDHKKAELQQLKDSEQELEVGRADRAKTEADRKADKDLEAIDDNYLKNTSPSKTNLSDRLKAATDAEMESQKVLKEREVAAQAALDVRVEHIKAQMAEVEKSGDSNEAKGNQKNRLQNELEELNARKKESHEQTEQEKAEITKKYEQERTKFSMEEQKRLDELKKQTEEEAKKKAEEKAKAEAEMAKRQEEDRKKNIQLIEEENRKLEKQIEHLREIEGTATNKKDKEKARAERTQLERKRGAFQKQQRTPTGKSSETDPIAGTDEGEGQNSGKDKGDGTDSEGQGERMQKVAADIKQIFDDIANSGMQSITSSIEGLIKGTTTWKDALSQVGSTVINSLINGFMKMVTTQITGLFTVDEAKNKISLGQRIRNMADAVSNMPNALLSSITSWGSAAAIGLAAITAAMSSFGGFESGGYTGDGRRSEVAGLVHRGEMVFDQPAVQAIGKDRLESMRMSRSLPVGLASASAGGGGLKAMSPNINVQSTQPKVIVVNSQEELMRVMKGSIGEEIMVSHIAKNKMRLGINS
ncbi:MAG TPA: hypothetical protein VGH19_02565 [Verrucomicrobiae bacterium]